MKEKEIHLNDKRLFYRVVGEGPIVVFLHGFAEEGTIWNRQFEALKDFKLIIPDLPGSGQSDAIEDMSMEGLAEAIREIVLAEASPSGSDKKVSGNVTLIGHSMGGYVTLAFAEKYPELLTGFGLFHSTSYADSEEKKQIRRKGIDFIQKNGAFEFLKTSIPNLYSPGTREHNPQLIKEQIEDSRNFLGSSLVSYYNAMIQRPDRTQVLNQSKVPVLFVLGRHDTAVPIQDGLQQCKLPENSYIHILESSGHMGMREEPEQSNKLLFNYLYSLHHQTR